MEVKLDTFLKISWMQIRGSKSRQRSHEVKAFHELHLIPYYRFGELNKTYKILKNLNDPINHLKKDVFKYFTFKWLIPHPQQNRPYCSDLNYLLFILLWWLLLRNTTNMLKQELKSIRSVVAVRYTYISNSKYNLSLYLYCLKTSYIMYLMLQL